MMCAIADFCCPTNMLNLKTLGLKFHATWVVTCYFAFPCSLFGRFIAPAYLTNE
jgi:hypothetical protein